MASLFDNYRMISVKAKENIKIHIYNEGKPRTKLQTLANACKRNIIQLQSNVLNVSDNLYRINETKQCYVVTLIFRN